MVTGRLSKVGNAQADGEADAMPFKLQLRGFDGQAQALGKNHLTLAVSIRQQNHEFFATVAPSYIGIPDILPNQLGGMLNHPVADLMAIGVVYLLEVIDIAHHQGGVASVAPMPGVVLTQDLFPMPAVEQTGQTIRAGEPLQLLIRGLQLMPVSRYVSHVIDNQ